MALAISSANAQTLSTPAYKVLAAFTPSDGELPIGNLAIDASGNIFAVAAHGGNVSSSLCKASSGCGTVFEVSPTSSGSWTTSLIHEFDDSANDGALPGSGLTLDSSGNLYGELPPEDHARSLPMGVAWFMRSRRPWGGRQAPKILYSFQGTPDGFDPESTLKFDKSGNLYGTTEDGGINNDGTVFEISPNGGGEWKETILFSFNNSVNHDGYDPQGGVTFEATGNLYGTTSSGAKQTGRCSPYGCGTVYELSPDGSGGWTETILLRFKGKNG